MPPVQGMDVHFLNHHNPVQGLQTPGDVEAVFRSVRPGYGTPTGQVCKPEILARLAKDGAKTAARQQRML